MILTDSKGVPFAKPEPTEFATTVEFLRAYWAYRDAIADAAGRAFDEQFVKSMRRGARKGGARG